MHKELAFLDGICPICGMPCGNGGTGYTLRCPNCGWQGEIAREDIETLERTLKEHKRKNRDQTIKADGGKPRLSLVPTQIIRDIAQVREYGVQKYGAPESWRLVERERYVDALLRHTLAYLEDPKGVDAESGLAHYKHIACNLAFLCEMEAIDHIVNPNKMV